jgi:hypothetical protein
MSRVVVALFVASVSLSACGQVFYMPVQYQYFSGGRAYYYGGSDPYVHARAQALSQEVGFGRTNGYAFVSGNVHTHREVVTEPTRAYTDMIPHWNGRVFGYTENDARNAAYQNADLYFRKSDLPRMSIRADDGTWVVPPQPTPGQGSIDIRPYRAEAKPVLQPTPILIIPKRLLDKPLWGPGTPMVDAR